MIYFASETDAKKYITDNKLGSDYKAYKYDKGQAYYRVNLMNDPESEDLSLKYRVVRNNYYRVNITAIKALGAPTGTGVVPTDPENAGPRGSAFSFSHPRWGGGGEAPRRAFGPVRPVRPIRPIGPCSRTARTARTGFADAKQFCLGGATARRVGFCGAEVGKFRGGGRGGGKFAILAGVRCVLRVYNIAS